MFNSIRWTLQLWHAGILLLALGSFGTVLYLSAERTALTEIDRELAGAARVFALAGPKSNTGPGFRSSGVQLAMAAQEGGVNPTGVVSDAAAPMYDVSGSATSPPAAAPGWLKNIPMDCLDRLGWNASDRPYFVVWGADGSVVRQSKDCPAIGREAAVSLTSISTDAQSTAPQFRERGDVREIMMAGPDGATILVGRSIRSEQMALANLRWSLLSAGAVVMGIGLLGGFALSQRVVRPIRLMSDAARSISGSDLSRRIDGGRIKSELGSLAETLNGTFERLESAFNRQAQFTADASHELRTPLAVIQAGSELALSRERSPEEYRAALETHLRASRRMHGLVESLLVLARADANALELSYSRFDLRRAVDDCVGLMLPLAKQRDIRIESEGAELAIEGDRDRILQLITNLVSNGIQYNGGGGTVRISVGRDGNEALITVKDTGMGIASDDEARIFERFFRADKARSRESGGCGLGLAICKSIVEAHGGTIAFVTAPAAGTSFAARLPILKS